MLFFLVTFYISTFFYDFYLFPKFKSLPKTIAVLGRLVLKTNLTKYYLTN